MEGDSVFVPDKRKKEESCETTRVHTFRIKGIPARFNVRLLDGDGNPRTGVRYTLDIDGKQTTGTLGADGKVSQIVTSGAQKAKLTIHAASPDEQDEVYEFALRHLNPVDHPTGLKARLKNLGCYSGEITQEEDEKTRDAIRKFQLMAGLEPTGEPTQETLDKLVEIHQS
jgi:N-acetylmuramoyl-L-alanine amidase